MLKITIPRKRSNTNLSIPVDHVNGHAFTDMFLEIEFLFVLAFLCFAKLFIVVVRPLSHSVLLVVPP
jgi:hypothetical protein